MDIPIDHEKCATCRWWTGARNVKFVGSVPKYVTVKGVLPADVCQAWEGNRKYGAASRCLRWTKWERL